MYHYAVVGACMQQYAACFGAHFLALMHACRCLPPPKKTEDFTFDPFPDLPADFGPDVPEEGIDGLLLVRLLGDGKWRGDGSGACEHTHTRTHTPPLHTSPTPKTNKQ
jgi:hypothetical protein